MTDDQDFAQFVLQIKRKTGIDLALYKEAQMKRRLTSLRAKRGYTLFSDYFYAIEKDQELFYEFLDRMTINVSEFFRNPSRWDVLNQKIIPRLLREKGLIKCWSAACSTGEEPYTLAFVLTNHMPLSQINILATDIDDAALAKAKTGVYSERSLQDCPTNMIARYFIKDGQNYSISDDVKRKIHFRRHNLLSDLYDSSFDLIVCRNVMIYFTEEAKHLLYQKFSRALRAGGVLFVGSTEQIFQSQKYQLEAEDTFFYRKLM